MLQMVLALIVRFRTLKGRSDQGIIASILLTTSSPTRRPRSTTGKCFETEVRSKTAREIAEIVSDLNIEHAESGQVARTGRFFASCTR
jgi:hypothetical protein